MPAVPRSHDQAFTELLVSSHDRLVGTPLLPPEPGPDTARWLYESAPFCLLVHDTSPDPLFIYANQASQRTFEYSWDEFVGMPSRLSAEAPNRDERQEFMDEVRRRGFVTNYRGRRIAKSGRRFWIEGAVVWNVIDDDGVLQGQAAAISRTSDA